MENITPDKAIAAAGEQSKAMLEKFFSYLKDTNAADNTAAKPFPTGIGHLKIELNVGKDISFKFEVSDLNYPAKPGGLEEYTDTFTEIE